MAISIAEYKQQNPAYANVPDDALARALWAKNYMGRISYQDYRKAVGLAPNGVDDRSAHILYTADVQKVHDGIPLDAPVHVRTDPNGNPDVSGYAAGVPGVDEQAMGPNMARVGHEIASALTPPSDTSGLPAGVVAPGLSPAETGVGEAGLSFATMIPALLSGWGAAGVSAIRKEVFGDKNAKPMQQFEKWRNLIQYEPKSTIGKQLSWAASVPFFPATVAGEEARHAVNPKGKQGSQGRQFVGEAASEAANFLPFVAGGALRAHMEAPDTSGVYVSAEQAGKTPEENAAATAAMKQKLDKAKVPYTEVKGVYGGVPEDSIKVPLKHRQTAAQIAKDNNQESVLIVDRKGNGHIVATGDIGNPEAKPMMSGTMQEITAEQAKGTDHSQMNGRYYTLREHPKTGSAAPEPTKAPVNPLYPTAGEANSPHPATSKLFKVDEPAPDGYWKEIVNIKNLHQTKHDAPANIERAKGYMKQALAGEGEGRSPIKAYESPTGELWVEDGNATVGAAKQLGLESIPAFITKMPEEIGSHGRERVGSPKHAEHQPESEAQFAHARSMHENGNAVQPRFEKLVNSVAKDLNTEVKVGPVKKVERIVPKGNRDYNGNLHGLQDINRAMLYADPTDRSIVDKVAKAIYDHGYTRTRIKYFSPKPDGYEQSMVNVVMPGGTVAEVKVTSPQMHLAQMAVHKNLYEARQEVESEIAKRGGEATEEQKKKIAFMNSQMRGIYTKLHDDLPWDKAMRLVKRAEKAKDPEKAAQALIMRSTNLTNSDFETGLSSASAMKDEVAKRGLSESQMVHKPVEGSTETGAPEATKKVVPGEKSGKSTTYKSPSEAPAGPEPIIQRRISLSHGESGARTPEDVMRGFSPSIRNMVRKLAARGVVHIASEPHDHPWIRRNMTKAQTKDIAAAWDSLSRELWVFSKNVPKGDEDAAILHEGTHAWQQFTRDTPRYNVVLNDYHRLLKIGDPTVLRAERRARADPTTARDNIRLNDERLAYFAEEAVRAGKKLTSASRELLGKIIRAVRMAFFRSPLYFEARKAGITMHLNGKDVAALARYTLKQMASEKIEAEHLPIKGERMAAQIAWHGTPHRGIEREGFRLQHIGKGEGARAYAWGIYFADRRGLAERYRSALSKNVHLHGLLVNGKHMSADELRALPISQQIAMEMVAEKGIDNAGKRLEALVRGAVNEGDKAHFENELKYLNQMKRDGVKIDYTGQVYHAEIPDNEDLLPWHRPISVAPKALKDKIDNVMHSYFPDWKYGTAERDGGKITGSMIYKDLEMHFLRKIREHNKGKPGPDELDFDQSRAAALASHALAEEGIPGTYYKAGQIAGGAEKGQHNFVIWDEAHLNNDVTPYYSMAHDTAPTELEGRAKNLAEKFRESGIGMASRAGAHKMVEHTSPLAAAPKGVRAMVKDYMNAKRAALDEWRYADEQIKKGLSKEEQVNLWNTLSKANEIERTKGVEEAQKVVDKLPGKQKVILDALLKKSRQVADQAVGLGMLRGRFEFYDPRIVQQLGRTANVRMTEGGKLGRPLDRRGKNFTTATTSMRGRKYITAEETEQAAKKKLGDQAELIRNIRALPAAIYSLENAVAGRTLLNGLRDFSIDADAAVAEESGPSPAGYFTLPNHPSFWSVGPKGFHVDEATGKIVPDRDENGDIIFERKLIHLHDSLKPAIEAVLEAQRHNIFARAFLALKYKSLATIIGVFPPVHRSVIFWKTMPLMPVRTLTFQLQHQGRILMENQALRRDAILHGVDPIASRGWFGAVYDIGRQPEFAQRPGRSWTAKLLGLPARLIDKEHEDAVRSAVDQLGNLWHDRWMWQKVEKTQFGIYHFVWHDLVKEGMDEETAKRTAAELANRYAGAIPEENTAGWLRTALNIVLFSRTFTGTNAAIYKDMLTGGVRAVADQVERDSGPEAVKQFHAAMRKKQTEALIKDLIFFHLSTAALQNSIGLMSGRQNGSDVVNGYMRRWHDMIAKAQAHPWDELNPIHDYKLAMSLLPQAENEPGKTNRIFVGYDAQGTAIYMKAPTGRIGEDLTDMISSPIQFARRKLSPAVSAINAILNNDRGYDRKIYDPDAEGTTGLIQNVGRVAQYAFMNQVPGRNLANLVHVIEGKDRTKPTIYQLVGMPVGLFFSKGYPGGPFQGELAKIKRQEEYRLSQVTPNVYRLLRNAVSQSRGASEQVRAENIRKAQKKAIDLMQKANIPVERIRSVIRYGLMPGHVNLRYMRELMETQGPLEKQRLMREQERQQEQYLEGNGDGS